MKMVTRRHALKTFAIAGTGTVALGLYTWRVEPHWLELTHPNLPIKGLPTELEGRTLAQLSDLHIGLKVDDDYIIESFRRVRDASPDFVVFTGDWITYRGASQFDQLRRLLPHMPHGKLGTIGILGNHDYGFNWRMLDVADQVTAIARDAGVTLLRNEAHTVAGLQFIGLDDRGKRARRVNNCAVPQSRRRGLAILGKIFRMDSCGPHARRPMQTAVPSAAALAREKQTLHFRRVRFGRRSPDVHQPRRRTFAASSI
jgi:hypothetical protein